MACCFRYKLFDWSEESGCQFASETDFITLGDGTTWCRFHLPMRDAAGNASPKAGWDDDKVDDFNQAVFHIIDAAIDAGNEDDHEADLTGVVFPGGVNFGRYGKERPFPSVRFRKAAFSGYASFSEAAFSGDAYFRKAVFSGIADFSGAAETPGIGGRRYDMRLTGTPNEDSAWQVEGEAVLPAKSSCSTFQFISFSGATFGKAIDFNNRRFTDTTRFRGTIFERAPKFHNAVLHQDTDFEGAKFRDVRSPDAERNYRTLKLAMETLRSRREEAMFFALEQRSLRHQPATPRMEKFVS